MRSQVIMTGVLATILACGWSGAQAFPRIEQGVSLTRTKEAYQAVIRYAVADEPAVVTIDVLTNGVSAGAAARLCVTGDVNRLVQPGPHAAVLMTTGALASVADKDVSVSVRAWATNCPPDYLVISLTNKNETARYYLTAEDVPDGVTHARYKKSHLVMRKIPAANVEWRMGSPELEIGRTGRFGINGGTPYQDKETPHYVRLTEDYYLGIYTVTYGQHKNAVGNFSYGMWGNADYADYRADDLPPCPRAVRIAPQHVSRKLWQQMRGQLQFLQQLLAA